MEIAPRITVDEKIRFGKPVIKGTRVPVDLVLGKLAGGMTGAWPASPACTGDIKGHSIT
ncbi:MAG: DUF433 domain-containing protein [Planctomycetota bacterium]|jgi:uncharacterized protein (DUF433 family)|nr:DUF433 domain-containing protein [Planctomycetota bacterium]